MIGAQGLCYSISPSMTIGEHLIRNKNVPKMFPKEPETKRNIKNRWIFATRCCVIEIK